MSEQFYDSTLDTLKHIKDVNTLLLWSAGELIQRASVHDHSKLESPEKEIFDQYTPILKTLAYGSDEYKKNMENIAVATAHHYAHNTHHPQHYTNGINGMDLFDVLEMFCDWVAAGKRTNNGSFTNSMEVNAKRYDMSPQLIDIFNNTAIKMGIIAKQTE
jgi:hypothetical protein